MLRKICILPVTLFVFCLLVEKISGHGMLLEPPNRSSLWRFDSTSTPNYDDNQNFCGGATVQWSTYGGKCGVCGDIYDAPHPQDNENTGKYGQGKVVRQYLSGSTVNVEVLLTANHMGYFNFSLCILQNPNAPESGEDCFQPLSLGTGEPSYIIVSTDKSITVDTQIKLPDGLTCKRCVLRWHYTAGNTWGSCDNGSYAEGCGPQENFRSCADVAII